MPALARATEPDQVGRDSARALERAQPVAGARGGGVEVDRNGLASRWAAGGSVEDRHLVDRDRVVGQRPARITSPLVPAEHSWRRPPPRRVRAVRDRLREVYGVPLAKPHGHPIAELILTVLSQSTSDRNRDVAYLALRERFPSWKAVRDAPVDEIEEAIRPGG